MLMKVISDIRVMSVDKRQGIKTIPTGSVIKVEYTHELNSLKVRYFEFTGISKSIDIFAACLPLEAKLAKVLYE